MTIQVINDFVALQQSSPTDQWKIKDDEAESYLRFRKKSYEEDDDYTANTSISSKDSDDDSVLSNASSSVASPSRVSFCEELITMEWTRPYTEPEDIPLLYYSTEETNRFRHEYRLERKMLSALDVDDALLAVDDELSEGCSTSTRLRKILTVNSSTCDVHQSESSSISTASSETVSPSSALRRAISRVVVLHNDKIASFSESSFSNDGNASPDFLTHRNSGVVVLRGGNMQVSVVFVQLMLKMRSFAMPFTFMFPCLNIILKKIEVVSFC